MSSTSIERLPEAGPRVPRTRLDRIAEWYRASPMGTWGVVIINALLQGAGIVLAFSLGFNVPMIKFVLTAVTGLSLIWRRRWPLGIVIVNNVALMIKMIKSDSGEFLLPLLIAVYTLIAIASIRQRLLGIAATLVFMFIPYLASFNGPLPGLMKERVPLSDFMWEGGLLIAVLTVASISRSHRESLEHGDTQLASHAAEQQLVVQRDAARYQARVAAELHAPWATPSLRSSPCPRGSTVPVVSRMSTRPSTWSTPWPATAWPIRGTRSPRCSPHPPSSTTTDPVR